MRLVGIRIYIYTLPRHVETHINNADHSGGFRDSRGCTFDPGTTTLRKMVGVLLEGLATFFPTEH